MATIVALLAEGVDRNFSTMAVFCDAAVALLAEGVDRNTVLSPTASYPVQVALLAEGVDRNTDRIGAH